MNTPESTTIPTDPDVDLSKVPQLPPLWFLATGSRRWTVDLDPKNSKKKKLYTIMPDGKVVPKT